MSTLATRKVNRKSYLIPGLGKLLRSIFLVDLSAPARMQQKVKGELQNAAGTIKMSMQGSYIQAVEGISQSRNKSLELEGEASWTFISMDFGNVVFKAVMEGKATWTSQAVNNVLIDYGIGFGFGNINFEDREADGNKWDLKLKTNSIINTNKLESEQNGLKLDFRLKF